MIKKTTFGSFIREKRIENGLTQKELAEILFLSESAISKWEMGKSYPDITMIPDICNALNISEHELINGANDTEYRKVKEQSRLYRKISESFFWVPTVLYIVTLFICFVCDISVNKRLTFTPVVFGSLLTAFTFIPSCVRFTEKHKLAVFTGSTFLSITLLFMICCIKYRQNWFGIAVMGTLLGYIIVFAPILMKKYFPRKKRNSILPAYFGLCFLCISLLMLAVNLTFPIDLKIGFLILLFAAMPFAVICAVHFIPCNVKLKASIDTFVCGITLYGTQFCVNKIMGINSSADYRIDFTDWVNCTNGNVYLLILIVCTVAATALLIAGLKANKQGKR